MILSWLWSKSKVKTVEYFGTTKVRKLFQSLLCNEETLGLRQESEWQEINSNISIMIFLEEYRQVAGWRENKQALERQNQASLGRPFHYYITTKVTKLQSLFSCCLCIWIFNFQKWTSKLNIMVWSNNLPSTPS